MNGISSQQMSIQKDNEMRKEIKGMVTLISVETLPLRILTKEQQNISQL
jgi:hypothetical protein